MAKPTENKEDKNLNKKASEIDTNTLMILNNIIIIVVLIVSLVAVYFLLESSIDKKLKNLAPAQEETLDEEEEEVKQEGILLDLGDFILNLVDTSQRRYLKVGVAIELSKTEEEIALANQPIKSGGHGHGSEPADPNAEIAAQMERYKPAIRDAVISILSNKSADELSSPTGKEIAKEEIKESVNGIFEGQREAMRVSFGQFIIQ